MQKLLVATHNQDKLAEYRALLADLPLTLTSLADENIQFDVDETGATFEENARLKAGQYAALSGLWTWADDSGLGVDALGGAPGVYSARYAMDEVGEGITYADNNRKLLRALADIPNAPRSARFHCTVALAIPLVDSPRLDVTPQNFEQQLAAMHTVAGALDGLILDQPRGEHGFGYDPLFYVPDLGVTLAELAPHEKKLISHRAHASALARVLAGAAAGEVVGQRPRHAPPGASFASLGVVRAGDADAANPVPINRSSNRRRMNSSPTLRNALKRVGLLAMNALQRVLQSKCQIDWALVSPHHTIVCPPIQRPLFEGKAK